ncbi:MAG: ABC transporter permease subunit [Ardenticatenaceae bacterium]|nr:ABC transporter permease subunit [Anaerolineales bacterium]MCB8938935.1 ABC transporter permease subunit [Ardenticatenaceae bacterium]MCB8974691.1 ABC transporter permease subunit [Ardenticatenaceae bacterium]
MRIETRQRHGKRPYLLLGLILLVGLLLLHHFVVNLNLFPEAWDVRLRDPLDAFKQWSIRNRTISPIFLYFFEPISDAIDFALRRAETFLLWLPWPVLATAVFLLAQKAGNLRLALLTTCCLLFMVLVGLWPESMQTLALMSVSVLIALLIGIPLGIWAGRNKKVERGLRPFLDAMQTMPAFVYLLPVVLFFGIARVPSAVATIIYALPPAIRLTTLGIREVDKETVEAARSFGATPRQILFKVQLPLALPSIMAGVNQTIMMALGIVVIAAMIGAAGLGGIVLDALRGLRVGQALEAGLAIVFLAVLLDRLSEAVAVRNRTGVVVENGRLFPKNWQTNRLIIRLESGLDWLYQSCGKLLARLAALSRSDFVVQYAYLFASLLLLGGLLWLGRAFDWTTFPTAWRLNLQDPVDTAVLWVRDNLFEFEWGPFLLGTRPFSNFVIVRLLDPLDAFFQEFLSWPALIVGVALLAYWVSGWRLALGSAAVLFGVGLLGMWELALVTLSQTIVAVFFSLMIALPLGVWAAKSDVVTAVLRPILDFLQTIPAFVYLVPVVMLFNVGRVPGIMASVLYALPPAIRLTNLGIRQASPEAVEAALAFGSTSRQLLFKVQLPLALPSIMTGINQTVMMVLAMVVVAGMVGGAGLGLEAVNGLARNQLGQGIEAGLAIVILAVVIDRLLLAGAARASVSGNR